MNIEAAKIVAIAHGWTLVQAGGRFAWQRAGFAGFACVDCGRAVRNAAMRCNECGASDPRRVPVTVTVRR